MTTFSIRPARPEDEARILAIADRLAAFGPTTRTAAEIAGRERQALAETLAQPTPGSALLVAVDPEIGVAGILFLETRRDYFTDDPHGHVAILALSEEAEGRGMGKRLLAAAEEWGRGQGFTRLTLSVFIDNERAVQFYARQGWLPELAMYFKTLA